MVARQLRRFHRIDYLYKPYSTGGEKHFALIATVACQAVASHIEKIDQRINPLINQHPGNSQCISTIIAGARKYCYGLRRPQALHDFSSHTFSEAVYEFGNANSLFLDRITVEGNTFLFCENFHIAIFLQR